MTNQSKWLISAYAIFFCGGTLVPLDYKLKAEEQWTLLKHSGASVLVTEYPIWRQLSGSAGRAQAGDVNNRIGDRDSCWCGFGGSNSVGIGQSGRAARFCSAEA